MAVLRRYKQGVLRDLSWLFNTSSHVSDGMLDDFAEASRSVINFGLPDLCGLTATSLRSTEMEMRLLDAIHFFEPRIIPQSLNIDIHNNPGEMSHNAFSFEIRGELWAHPLPDSLFVRTEVDLETGQCNLEE